MPDFLKSPSDLMRALLSASAVGLGVCLWLVWNEMRRLAQREERLRRETERYVNQQLALLSEKMSGELIRRRREAEQAEHTLESLLRRRLDELEALIGSLRVIATKLEERSAAPRPGAEEAAREGRANLNVIARPAKTGS